MLISRIRNFIKRQDGSITLESVIIFPFYLAFLLLLINFIKVSIVYVAVDHAVSETTKLVATHSYPLKYMKEAAGKLESSANDAIKDTTAGKAMEAVPVDTGGVKELVNYIINKGYDAGLQLFAQNKINDYLPEQIRPDVKVEQAKMCTNFNSKLSKYKINGYDLGPEDVAIVVTYKVRLTVPFVPKLEYTLSDTAVERAWLDD